MKELILIKNGELALKGLNRNNFETILVKNIKHSIKDMGEVKVFKAQSTIYIQPEEDDFNFDKALEKIGKIFGIAGFQRACVCEKTMEDILEKAPVYLEPLLKNAKTFKVEAKRADKRFPLKSPDICREVGGCLLKNNHHLKVDVHNPDVTVTVEIRDFGAYIRGDQLVGAGGMPIGTGGKASILISGGIDSPVAAWMMAKRGLELTAIHFASPPYTSERAEEKVKSLLSKVAEWSGPIRMGIVPFTEIQEQIARNCPDEFFTLVMRRFMMKISQEITEQSGGMALITGESLGQVASQTLPALCTTDSVCHMPVMRPLIGMDKEEIIAISRKIDTFDISTLPFEDCCTVFTPKHPKTKPTVEQCEKAESKLNTNELIEKAVKGTVFTVIH